MNTYQIALTAFILIHLNLLNAQNSLRALFIGVGEYPEESGWNKLHAANDLALLETVLTERQVPPTMIRKVTDDEATLEGIEAALSELADSVKEGETVWLHFSGHGQQMQDQNNDEIDGLDEALVPYDAQKNWKSNGYKGDKHLRDDRLGKRILDLRLRLGKKGQVFITIDACHSGTATRGFANARGTDVIMADPGWLKNQRANRNRAEPELDTQPELQNAAPFVLLFSSAPHELSYETVGPANREAGLFTLSLSSAFAELPPGGTYETLFAGVRRRMLGVSLQQTPQIEGDGQLVVGGGALSALPGSFPVRTVIDSGYIVLGCGRLQGLTPGAVLRFFPAGITDTAGREPYAIGMVEQGDWFTCDVALQRPASPEGLMAAKAWLGAPGAPFDPAVVRIDALPDPLGRAVHAACENAAFLRIAQPGDAPVLVFGGDSALWVRTADGRELIRLDSVANAAEAARQSVERARKYLFAAHLRSAAWSDPLFSAKLELTDMTGQQVISERQFAPGDRFRIMVQNTGAEPFYFAILDVSPNDELNLLAPYDRPGGEYRLEPGQEYLSDFYFETDQIPGTDVLKLLLAPTPLDWSWLGLARGQGTNAPFTDLLQPQALRSAAENGSSRGGGQLPGTGSIISLAFKTVQQ